jgi:hypothetical protein
MPLGKFGIANSGKPMSIVTTRVPIATTVLAGIGFWVVAADEKQQHGGIGHEVMSERSQSNFICGAEA